MADPHGISIAFGDGPLVETPTWTRIDTLSGCRVQSWTISRGRASEFEPIGAGTATVSIVDLEGLFDPTNTGGPYFGQILPDKQAAIALQNPVGAHAWHTLFRGFVEEIDYTLDPTEQFFTLDLQLIDAFGWFNDHELRVGEDGQTPPAGSEGNIVYGYTSTDPTTGAVKRRIDDILDDIGWPLGLRDVFSGNVRLTQSVYAPGTPALAALQDAADGEFPGVSVLFVDASGVVAFRGRQPRFRPDVAEYAIRKQEVGDPSVWQSDATVCPVSELGFNLGKANLWNSILAYPQHTAIDPGPPVEATVITETEIRDQLLEDTTSIDDHGTKSLSFTDLLTLEGLATSNTALQETLLFATYYRDNYASIVAPRVNRMVFKSVHPSHPNSDPLWTMICNADISDLLTLTTSHPGGGGFTADEYFVEGLRYECRPGDVVPIIQLELDVSPRALFTTNPFDADPDP